MRLRRGRTVVIISHSLSQIIDADKIYVLKNGTVVQSGTHESLYLDEGVYKEIFDASARSLNLDRLLKTISDRS